VSHRQGASELGEACWRPEPASAAAAGWPIGRRRPAVAPAHVYWLAATVLDPV